MIRESVQRQAQEMKTAWPLSAEDWEAIIDQAVRVLETVATLDELPLERVEPAAVYSLGPDVTPAFPSQE